MKQQEYWVTMTDQVPIYVKKWAKRDSKPRAIIQLAHGMAEHIDRYDEFATYLVKNNMFVIGNDHRGHGKTGERQGLLGYFSDEDGFTKTAEDLYEVTQQIKREYPYIPLFLFGHSMGSFLARKYMQTYSHAIDGVILSGTGYVNSITSKLAKKIAYTLPAKEQSHIMQFLTFGSYNKKTDKETSFDWLSRDKEAVQKYIDDPYAGFVPTARFFYDLMNGLGQIHRPALNQAIRKDLPVLLISGDADPVGNYAKGIWKVASHYDEIGLMNIKTMLFEGGRHELLHEQNKKEVYQAILDWLNKTIP